MSAINHPSYSNTGSTEQDVSRAIDASVANDGKIMSMRYSQGAAAMLARECEWESADGCGFRGEDCYGRTWRVRLTEPSGI